MQKIDLENRLDLFRGCVKPGVRMPEALLDFYSATEARSIRARSATGVRIAMVTDAAEMEYSIVQGASARPIFTTDILIDGVKTTVEGDGPHKISLPAGEKTVVIHLPHLVVIEKLSLSVSEGAVVKALPVTQKKLLVCGDSILQGMTCSTPTKAVGALLAEKLGMDFHNTSVGGADMRAEAVESTIAIGGDVIVVCFGINDVFHATEPELFRERTRKVLELLDGFSGKAFIVVPIPSLAIPPEKQEEYCAVIREEQKGFSRVKLIEGKSFYPWKGEVFADGTHPNDEGMEIYAQGLAEAMADALR